MGLNRLQGMPWHEECLHKGEDDDRRHKARCKYYSFEDNQCAKRNGKCIGSRLCEEYAVMTEEEWKARQARRRKSVKSMGEDDCYWY